MRLFEDRNSKIALGTLAGIVVTTLMWRLAYPLGSVSIVFLLPLVALTVFGSYKTLLLWRQATLGVLLTESTPFRKILTGKTISMVHALIVGVGAMFLVAYKGVVADGWEIVLAISAILATGYAFPKMIQRLEPHVNHSYLLTAASQATTAILGSAFFLIYLFSLWALGDPQEVPIGSSIQEAILNSMNKLPQGQGLVAEFVEISNAIDIIKLWVIENFKSSPFVLVLGLVYSALFGYFQVRVITSVVCAVWQILEARRTVEAAR